MSEYASADADELAARTGIPVVVVPGSDTTLDEKAYETLRVRAASSSASAEAYSLITMTGRREG